MGYKDCCPGYGPGHTLHILIIHDQPAKSHKLCCTGVDCNHFRRISFQRLLHARIPYSVSAHIQCFFSLGLKNHAHGIAAGDHSSMFGRHFGQRYIFPHGPFCREHLYSLEPGFPEYGRICFVLDEYGNSLVQKFSYRTICRHINVIWMDMGNDISIHSFPDFFSGQGQAVKRHGQHHFYRVRDLVVF